VLVEVACVAEEAMELDLAAQVLGAAASIEGHESFRAELEDATYRIRSKSDEAGFDSAWRAGKAMTWEETDALMESLSVKLENEATAVPERSAAPHRLTSRELEVLVLLADGRSNRAIADTLSLSERTVENHVQHLLTKLDLDSRAAAAAWAVRHGLA
jgi:DNA-binding CsgD family transcriptional regulator